MTLAIGDGANDVSMIQVYYNSYGSPEGYANIMKGC